MKCKTKKGIIFLLSICLMIIPISSLIISILGVHGALTTSSFDDGVGNLHQNGYIYSDWNTIITVGMDGSLEIQEKMTYRLDAGSYGQAERHIPWEGFHDINYWSISSGPSTPDIIRFNSEVEGNYIYFQWEWIRDYVPDNTEFTFTLTYNVSSAMDLRGNRDRVYWNVIGEDFDVTIYDIDTTVVFPKLFNEEEIRSTTYYKGSNPGDDEGEVINTASRTTVVFHQNTVYPGESYTIDTDSPPAGIDMPFSWRVYLQQNWVISIFIGFVPVFLFFLFAFIFRGIDPRIKTIPELNEVSIRKCPQCSYREVRKVTFCSMCGNELKTINEVGPPNNLSPAEVGTLLDEKFDRIDFVAEFFWLAEQGYLRLIQTPETDEIYFQRTTKSAFYGNLSKFDRKLLEFVEDHSFETIWFKQTNNDDVKQIPVEVSSLSIIKQHASSLWLSKSSIYKKLSGGETNYFVTNPDKIRTRYAGNSFAIGIIGSIGLWVLSLVLHVNNLKYGIIGIFTACFFGYLLSSKMPKLTKEGAKVKASWKSYMQLIRGKMLGFPDPYEQFNFSMDHFSYLLVNPDFDLPKHLRHISKDVSENSPPSDFHYTTPYWYYYPRIYYPTTGNVEGRPIAGFDSLGRGFESLISGISSVAESLPKAISNLGEGLSKAVGTMGEGFVSTSSSGGSSGFGGGFSGGGGGGGGGGIS